MRITQRPPSFSELLDEFAKDPSRATAILGAVDATGAFDPRYLHWDAIRRRDPPVGLSHEAWWLAIKWFRRRLAKPTPLTSVEGHNFVYSPTDRVQELVSTVDLQGTGRHQMALDIASPASRDRYLFNSIAEEAIASSLLEGAALSRLVAKEMLRTGRKPKSVGERMIRNNFAAMRFLLSVKDRPLTPEIVLELQDLITRDTIKPADAAGRFRRDDEVVQVFDERNYEIVHVPPPAGELEDRLVRLCEFANKGQHGVWHHPVVRAILLHLWLAYDHPFVDGNGRTARALFYWGMLRQGYWVFEFVSISPLLRKAPAAYARSFLHVETDEFDATYFILAQLKTLCSALDSLWARVEGKEEEVRSVESRLRSSADVNYRQLALMGHALRNPDARFTIRSHRNSHGVAYDTARTDLLDLVDKGLLEKWKRGNALVFGPASDLELQLKQA